MIKNYLKISIRKLWKEKEYAFLNILGLTVGVAVSLLIILFVVDEFSYDDFHEHSEQIYRVQLGSEFGGEMQIKTILPEMIGPELKHMYPEVKEAVRYTGPYDNVLVYANGKSNFEKGHITADPSFFELFSFKRIAGDLETALKDPVSIVLTRSLAEKYFGTIDVLGKSFTIYYEEKIITAVIEDPPHNTHLDFTLISPSGYDGRRSWQYSSAKTYILLGPQADIEQLRAKLPEFIEKHAYQNYNDGLRKADPSKYALFLQPVVDIHLNPQGYGTSEKAGPLQYIYVFNIAAILILGIAIINYMNIATARSGSQAREVGVRKTVGATRKQLISRFLTESMFYSLVASALAVLIVELSLPYFNNFVGKGITLSLADNFWLLPALGSIALFIGLLSGSYGATVMSSFKPAAVIRGNPLPGQSGAGFRKTLVVMQFTASITLILITVLIYQQMEYVQETRLDSNDDEIVVLQNYDNLDSSYSSFRQKLLRNPEIDQVTTGHMPGSVSSRGAYTDSTGARTEVLYAYVGYDYADVLGLEVTSGRDFSPEFSDSNAVLLNQSAARWLGVERAYGQEVERANGRVVGIVEDFHMMPLYNTINPMILGYTDKAQRHILVKLKSGQIVDGLDRIRSTWDEFVPDQPVLYSFLDDELDKAYKSELMMAKIFSGFSGIAILLACLGLFGLSAYNAHLRTKEIGIRKVFGATVADVVALLSKDFIKLVLIGFLISAPLAYYFINLWLKDFAYKTTIGPIVFFITGIAVIVIALATVSWQSIRAALANPVDSLRSE